MTVIISCINNIICRIISLGVLNIHDPFLREIDTFHILDCGLHIAIIRIIIDKNYMVILIFLHYDGTHYFYVSVVLDVVVREDCYAESDLFLYGGVLGDVVFLVVLLVLELLDCVVLR